MYNLGSIDTSGVTGDMFFDKTLYDEGVAMMKDGKYQDAISKFGELKSTDSESYDFYKAEDKLMESQEALVKFYLNSGEYQLALDKLEVCEKEFPNAYEKLEGRKVESEIRKKGNLYSVGCIVPSGGYVFYDKGYESDGWRYLEAAPADLRVVNGVPTVDSTAEGYSSASKAYVFGYNRSSASGNDTIVGTYTSLGMGKMNTQLLINAMGDSAYSGNYAARLCDILTYVINGITYDDWFLPSRDELNLMYTNLMQAGLGSFDDGFYWSSSEFNDTLAWAQLSFYESPNKENYRSEYCRIRPVRAF